MSISEYSFLVIIINLIKSWFVFVIGFYFFLKIFLLNLLN